MIEIDGSQKSGSGTILRLSVALAAITGEQVHIFNIRKRRSEPGLRPQHLEAVLTAARLCNATIKGAFLGSEELWFKPGKIAGGQIKAEIGTAGSIPMLILTVLPMCIFAQQPVSITISKGGTDVFHSPTINYIRFVLLSALEQMGVKAALKVNKYGYYPKGMGEVTLDVQPCTKMFPFRRTEFGKIAEIKGISVCTFLADRNVAMRQAKETERLLKPHGYHPKIEVVNDFSNPLQKGSSLVLWFTTDTNAILGSDSIGEIHKPSEKVAYEAIKNLLIEIQAKATVDVHLADMLIPFIALAKDESEYLTRILTEHIESNMWLATTFLGTKFRIEKNNGLYKISKTQ